VYDPLSVLFFNFAEGHWAQSLAQELKLGRANGYFPAPRPEEYTGHTYPVGQIELVEEDRIQVIKILSPQIDLQPTGSILDVGEGGLSHVPKGLDTACDLNPGTFLEIRIGCFGLVPAGERLRQCVRSVE
jgi:hypothetical protein